MAAPQQSASALSPAEVFACLYAELAQFGADMRGYESIRPLGRLFVVGRDPALLRRLTVEVTSVDILAGLLGDIVEGHIAISWCSTGHLQHRAELARMCRMARSCQNGLQRYLTQAIRQPSISPKICTVDWERLELRLMAPWS